MGRVQPCGDVVTCPTAVLCGPTTDRYRLRPLLRPPSAPTTPLAFPPDLLLSPAVLIALSPKFKNILLFHMILVFIIVFYFMSQIKLGLTFIGFEHFLKR
jgi:hypothetical protein